MVGLGVVVFLLCSAAAYNAYTTAAPSFSDGDRNRFKLLFNSAQGNNDLEVLAFAARGLSALDERFNEAQKVCETVKKNFKTDDVASIHFATVILKKLEIEGVSCQVSWGSASDFVSSQVLENATPQRLYYAISALSYFGKSLPKEIHSILSAASKNDDSPMGQAYTFYSASYLSSDLKKFHDSIEDIIAQADEVNEEYFQFDSGLKTTAMVIHSTYVLSEAAKLEPAISDEKVVKFANYLLNRKFVDSVVESSLVLSAVKALTTSKFYVPLSISLASSVSVSEKSPKVLLKVTDLMGGKVAGVSLVAETARHIIDNAVILSKMPLVQSTTDLSIFELDLYKLKPAVGFYRIILTASTSNKELKLLGNQDAEIIVKVTTQVIIKDTEVLVLDKEQGTVLKSLKVQHPDKVSVEADFHQKFVVKFRLADKKTEKSLTAHQTFVRLLNDKTKHEVIYVAEEDGYNAYKFDLDIGAKGKDFNGLSGKYVVDIIIGDAIVENPLSWSLADVKLTFSDEVTQVSSDPYLFSKKPEIKHLFREPEKRPPTAVSNFFTGLVLVPFCILLLLWLKIGINMSNFPCSLFALGFHFGIGAIFGLYFLYFWKLNMFETLKYLGLLGIPTFICGHSLLSTIAAKRK